MLIPLSSDYGTVIPISIHINPQSAWMGIKVLPRDYPLLYRGLALMLPS